MQRCPRGSPVAAERHDRGRHWTRGERRCLLRIAWGSLDTPTCSACCARRPTRRGLVPPRAAVAGAGGEPASADQPGCTFSAGVTTCTRTTEIPGTPTTVTTPGSWTSTAGPIYDFQPTTNIPNCDVAPQPNSSTTTTITPTLVTATTAHRGAPGSNGKDLGTTTSSTPGTSVVTTIGKASPGAAEVEGSSVTATLSGLQPNTEYVTGARRLAHRWRLLHQRCGRRRRRDVRPQRPPGSHDSA